MGMTVHRMYPFEDTCIKFDSRVLGLLERTLRWSILHNRSGCQRPRFSGSLSISLSLPKRTSTTDCHTHDGLSCTTVLVVRDTVPKGLSLFF